MDVGGQLAVSASGILFRLIQGQELEGWLIIPDGLWSGWSSVSTVAWYFTLLC